MKIAKGIYVCDAGSIKVGVNGMSLLISNGIGDGRYSWEVTTDEPSWKDGWRFETCLQGKDIQIFDYDCNGGEPYPEKFTGSFMVYTKEGAIKFHKWSEKPNHWGENIDSREKIYREVKAEYEMEDIRCRAEETGFEMDEDEVKRAQEYMENHHDCNITYWDNVDAAIQSATCGR